MERFFDEEFVPLIPAVRWHEPAVDVSETDSDVVVEMPLAGVDPAKVEISVENGNLLVKGHTEEEREEKGKYFYRKEIRRGAFERVIGLPLDVKSEEARAESVNGMLKITLPKSEKALPKKIEVRVASKK